MNVSYDGGRAIETAHGSVRFSAAAERAIERLSYAKIRVGVNVVLTRHNFGRLVETVARARSLGAAECLRRETTDPDGRPVTAHDTVFRARRV